MGPRVLQQQIYSTFFTDVSVWSAFKDAIALAYNPDAHGDFHQHIIREYNRKISSLELSADLYFTPYGAGFGFWERFLKAIQRISWHIPLFRFPITTLP